MVRSGRQTECSRLQALAAVADPGLAEVADGAHQRHARGVAPVRHAAIPPQAPAHRLSSCYPARSAGPCWELNPWPSVAIGVQHRSSCSGMRLMDASYAPYGWLQRRWLTWWSHTLHRSAVAALHCKSSRMLCCAASFHTSRTPSRDCMPPLPDLFAALYSSVPAAIK